MHPQYTVTETTVKGVSIHYLRTGDRHFGGQPMGGYKQPLVYIHGFSGSGLCYLSFARDLSDRFDLVFPDLRGHGQSQGVQPGEKTDLTAEMAEFIRSLHLKNPILGGASLGASISARIEARYPGLVKALILEDPAWWDPNEERPAPQPAIDDEPAQLPYDQWLLAIKTWTVEQVMDHGRANRPSWTEPELRAWAETVQRFDPNFLTIHDNRECDFPTVVERIHVPTLLITGDRERGAIVGGPLAFKAAGQNPLIRAVHIPGAGHNVRDDNYSAFMEALQAFTRSLEE